MFPSACGGSDSGGEMSHDAVPSGGGGGGGTIPGSDVPFPWAVFDGSVPDVPPAAPPARTFYCDPVRGNDAWDGSSISAASDNVGPKKTLQAALDAVKPGDAILLAGGVYRERPDFGNIPNGASAITIGSYGHGTGAPILDGGIKPGTWTKTSGTVWQTSTASLAKITSNQPVLGVYVNSGKSEWALREVAHGQLQAYGSDPLPNGQTQADIKDNSNKWFFDRNAKVLYADFGGTLGGGDPNAADVSILYNSANGSNGGHEPLIVLTKGSTPFHFVGLTIRAGSWHGLYIQSSGNTVERCDVKFNGGGGIFFDTEPTDTTVTTNTVRLSRVWMNVLDNWPRFNNANTTGGWPGALSWYSQSNALAEGNVVYQNGGEGLILWGTNANGGTAHTSVDNVVRHNVIFDNWSVNLYLDNTQNARVEQSYVFDHPRDPTMTFDGLLSMSSGYNTDWGKRLTPANISLADEPGSAFDGHAHLSDITVVNNLFAGGKFGFVDYADGTSGVIHGLKSCVIANNTWILGDQAIPGQDSFGWRHLFNDGSTGDASANSLLQNNLFVTATSADHFIDAGHANAGTGITCDNNFYSGPGQWITAGNNQNFSAWKSAHPWDQHSVQADALVVDPTEFYAPASQKPVYDWKKAALKSGSPAKGAGVDQTSKYTTDFTGATRKAGPFDIGAIIAP